MENALTSAIDLPSGAPAHTAAAGEFEELVRRHQRRLHRVLLMLVRNADDADTLTQECFLRAFQRLSTFRGDSSIETWLLRIAVNLYRDHVRNQRIMFWKRFQGLDDDAAVPEVLLVAPDASQERRMIARDELQAVWAAVAELSPRQREVFTLRFVEDMDLREIAETLGLKVGTVKAQLFRSITAVRKKLEEQQWT